MLLGILPVLISTINKVYNNNGSKGSSFEGRLTVLSFEVFHDIRRQSHQCPTITATSGAAPAQWLSRLSWSQYHCLSLLFSGWECGTKYKIKMQNLFRLPYMFGKSPMEHVTLSFTYLQMRCETKNVIVDADLLLLYFIYFYYLHVRVGVNHASMIHNFAYAEHDKQDYDRGKHWARTMI